MMPTSLNSKRHTLASPPTPPMPNQLPPHPTPPQPPTHPPTNPQHTTTAATTTTKPQALINAGWQRAQTRAGGIGTTTNRAQGWQTHCACDDD